MPWLPRYNPRPHTDPSFMSTPTSKAPESAVRELVESYVDPYLGTDLRTAGAVRRVELGADRLDVALTLGFPARHYRDELAAAIEQRVRPVVGARSVAVEIDWQVAAQVVAPGVQGK